MDKRNRNTALVLIAAGLFILFEHYVSFFTIAALVLVLLGFYKIRSGPVKSGYLILGIGVVIFFSNHSSLLLSIVLISLGFYYLNSKRVHQGEQFQKHSLIESIKWDKETWVLKNTSMWNLIGEIYMDLSLALPELKETTIVMQGVLGDVDIIVPEDMGVSVTASVIIGQIDVAREKDAGLLNKIMWKSPNYEASDQRVNIIVSYLIGDIDIKIM